MFRPRVKADSRARSANPQTDIDCPILSKLTYLGVGKPAFSLPTIGEGGQVNIGEGDLGINREKLSFTKLTSVLVDKGLPIPSHI